MRKRTKIWLMIAALGLISAILFGSSLTANASPGVHKTACEVTRYGHRGYRLCGTAVLDEKWPDGHTETFIVGTDHAVWHIARWMSGWASMGGRASNTDTAYYDYTHTPARPTISVKVAGHGNWCSYYSRGWSRWYSCNKEVAIARAELGTRDDARNCVKDKPYGNCIEWCADFATWAWRKAGWDIPRMTFVPDVYDWAVRHGKWYGTSQLRRAQPGDLIIFGSARNRYHIGIVTRVNADKVWVLSGNTSDPKNSSRQGVFEKEYDLSAKQFYGLVHH